MGNNIESLRPCALGFILICLFKNVIVAGIFCIPHLKPVKGFYHICIISALYQNKENVRFCVKQ